MNYKAALLFISTVLSVSCTPKNEWNLLSPDKNIKMKVFLGKEDTKDAGKLFYEVSLNKDSEYITVINSSPLGLIRDVENLASGLKFVNNTQVISIDENYEMKSGKKKNIHNAAKELSLTFSNSNNTKLQLVIHTANDGVAFRYILPGNGKQAHTINKEVTGFSIPTDAKTWIPTYDKPAPWSPGYETYYSNGTPIENAPDTFGWSFPALFQTKDCWILLSEAGPYTDYCASHLEQKVNNGTYKIRFPEKGERNGDGVVNPSSTLPWTLPWRFLIIGKDLNTIIESEMVNNLSEPNKIENTAWIKPGRASWSWWSSTTPGRKYDTLTKYVDLAADMGWEYTLVDAGWEKMTGGTIEDLIKYANSKDVGVILWYNSGGRKEGMFKNDTFAMENPVLRKIEMQRIHNLGVKGVKIDFFNSDKQDVMKIYQGILKDAAKNELLVDFHGCTLPRGWTRTYPNLLTQEAIRGGESYRYDELFPENAPWHNTIAFFVRGVVGPMDFGPVMLSNQKFAHKSTYSHELATCALLESGIIHFADMPIMYNSLDKNVKEFLSTVPAAWKDIKLIDGYPGEFVVVARQSLDEKWYILCINGKNKVKEVDFKLSFLQDKRDYSMEKITDKDNKSFNIETVTVKNGDEIKMDLLPYGGFVLIIQ